MELPIDFIRLVVPLSSLVYGVPIGLVAAVVVPSGFMCGIEGNALLCPAFIYLYFSISLIFDQIWRIKKLDKPDGKKKKKYNKIGIDHCNYWS